MIGRQIFSDYDRNLRAHRLQTQRLILRPPQRDDFAQWAQVRGRNRDYLAPFEPTWPEDCLSREFFLRRLRRQHADIGAGRGYSFLIFERGNGDVLAGGINVNNVCRGAAQYATLGYWLDRERQGKGLMTEALAGVIGHGFSALRLHRFNAACLPGNARSVALLCRIGFAEEGFARKYVQIAGEWQDHRLFGLPVEVWRGAALSDQDHQPAEGADQDAEQYGSAAHVL